MDTAEINRSIELEMCKRR